MGGYEGKLGWTVGLDSWLDDPASKVKRYWRAIEDGKDYGGLILIGLWGNRAGSNARPGNVREGPLDEPMKGRHDQKFVPFGTTHSSATALHRARFAFWWFITKGKMGRPSDADLSILHVAPRPVGEGKHEPKDPEASANRRMFGWIMSRATVTQIPFVSAVALKPIPAHHYYITAVDSFNPGQRQIDMLRQEIGSQMKGAFTIGKARTAMAIDSPGAKVKSGAAAHGATRSVGPNRPNFGEHGRFTLTAHPYIQDMVRTGSGTFPAGQWQAMLIDVNRKVAYEYQLHVMSVMRQVTRGRPPTSDLLRATEDSRNRKPV